MKRRRLTLALAAIGFLVTVAVLAWRSERWRAPDAVMIEPKPAVLAGKSAGWLTQAPAAPHPQPSDAQPVIAEPVSDLNAPAPTYEEERTAREANPLRPARTR